MFVLLGYFGGKGILFAAIAVEGHKEAWVSYLVSGLIIAASSLLTKMLLDWFREKHALPSASDTHDI